MKVVILLAIVGWCAGNVVPPVSPIFYSNLIAGRVEIPVQRLDVATTGTGSYLPTRGFIVYNVPQVNTNVRTIPTAVFSNGRPTIAHIPTTYNYYGTPVYDFRFPFNPVSPPGSKPPTPTHIPGPETPRPSDNGNNDDDDGIEKLDEKVEPAHDPLGETAGAAISAEDEDDSIAIEAP